MSYRKKLAIGKKHFFSNPNCNSTLAEVGVQYQYSREETTSSVGSRVPCTLHSPNMSIGGTVLPYTFGSYSRLLALKLSVSQLFKQS